MTKQASSRPWLKPVILLTVLAAALGAAWYFKLGDKVGELKGWVGSLGNWGPIVFILIYIAATVAMIPGTILTAAAGALFGPVAGVIYVSIASTVASALCFLIA